MSEADEGAGTPDSIGERLKSAREGQGLSLEDVAKQTRIPIRHLQHIEKGEWDALPATTYSIGFARAYANAVGLNGAEIGVELREQLGASQAARYAPVPAYYEPADPARVPPRSLALVAAGIALMLVVAYVVWRSLAVGGGNPSEVAVADVSAPPAAVAPAENHPPAAAPATPAPAATGPVILTATNDVWLRIYEADGGPRIHEGMMKAGERYEVPATARRPQILTGRPDAITVTVGTTAIPQLGPAERTISDVSLLPADLLARLSPQPGAPAPQTR